MTKPYLKDKYKNEKKKKKKTKQTNNETYNNPSNPKSMPLLHTNPPPTLHSPKERGVSIDQDGKSNVWAIEPKVEIEDKNRDDKIRSVGGALLGLVVIGGGCTGILGNL